MSSAVWKVFDLEQLKRSVAGTEPRIVEFLRGTQMSCAIYRLPVGARDMQAPHLEDEIYVVLEGKARLRIDGQERDVGDHPNVLWCDLQPAQESTVHRVVGGMQTK